MRTVHKDKLDFVYFIDKGGWYAGPYMTKQPAGPRGKLRKFKLVEVPLDAKPDPIDKSNVLFEKTIDGVNILITNGPVSDKLIFNAHVWVDNMKLHKNHSNFDDQTMIDEFCGQLNNIKKKYNE